MPKYAVTLAALLLTGGALGDARGRRRVFAAAWSSSCFRVVRSFTALAAHRGARRSGLVLRLVPGSLSLISASFPPSDRGRAIGTWSGFTATAALGPVLGGWLVEHLVALDLHQSPIALVAGHHDVGVPEAVRTRRPGSTGRALCWQPLASAVSCLDS